MFSGVRRWTMSTSNVTTGAPCSTAASAPTTKYSTPCSLSAASRGTKLGSLTDDSCAEDRACPTLDNPQAFDRRHVERASNQSEIDPVVVIRELWPVHAELLLVGLGPGFHAARA